ncbi:TKL/ARK protein kinase, partial [Salpingoeca rosetta]
MISLFNGREVQPMNMHRRIASSPTMVQAIIRRVPLAVVLVVLVLLQTAFLLVCRGQEVSRNTFEIIEYDTPYPHPSQLWQATLLRHPTPEDSDIPDAEIGTMMRVRTAPHGKRTEEVVVLFGGETLGLSSGNVTLNTDTWLYRTYQPQYWLRCNPEVVPQPRLGHNMFRLPASDIEDAAYLFGGTDRHEYFNDIWTLRLSGMTCTWTQLHPSNQGPSPRTFAASTHVKVGNHYLMLIWGGCVLLEPDSTNRCKTGVADSDTIHMLNMTSLQWDRITLAHHTIVSPRTLSVLARFEDHPETVYLFGGTTIGRSEANCDLYRIDIDYTARAGDVQRVWSNDMCANEYKWLQFEARFAVISVEDSFFFLGAATTELAHGTLASLAFRPRDNFTTTVASDVMAERFWPVSFGHLDVAPGSFAFASPSERGFGFAVGLMQDQFSGTGAILWQYSPFWRNDKPYLQWHPELVFKRPFPRRGHTASTPSVGTGMFTFGGILGRVTSYLWTLGPLEGGVAEWRYVWTPKNIPPRYGHAMLPLGDGHRLVLGGWDAALNCHADAWLLWVDMSRETHAFNATRVGISTPGNQPAWAGAGGMAYSCPIATPEHTRCFLFGGACRDSTSNNLYQLDYRPNPKPSSPTPAPSSSSAGAVAMPELLLTMVDGGGEVPTSRAGDNSTSTGGGDGDTAAGGIVSGGGDVGGGDGDDGDTHRPLPRQDAFLFSGDGEIVTLFGGLAVQLAPGQRTLGDVWEYSVAEGKWSQLYAGYPNTNISSTSSSTSGSNSSGDSGDSAQRAASAGTDAQPSKAGHHGGKEAGQTRQASPTHARVLTRVPPARYRGCSLRASDSKWLIFGGRNNTPYGDLWEYDAVQHAFTELKLHAGDNALKDYHVLRWGAACVMHDDLLLAHGGLGVFDLFESTLRLRPACNDLQGLPAGTTFLNGTCHVCPIGTYFDHDEPTCQRCPEGTTTEEAGSKTCDVCVPGYCRFGHTCVIENRAPKCHCRAGYSGERCQLIIPLYVSLGLFFGLGTVALVVWLARRQRRARHTAELKEKLLSHATDQLREKDMELQELARVFVIDPTELVLMEALDKDCPGATGDVWKGQYKNQVVAVKRLKAALVEMDESMIDMFEREVRVMRGLRHKNIVLFYGAGMFEQQPFLVMEYCPRGSLHSVLAAAAAAAAAVGEGGGAGRGIDGRTGSLDRGWNVIASASGDGHVHGGDNSSNDSSGNGGNGSSSQDRLSWRQRYQFLIDTAEGMAYLHSLRPPRIHRDLKSMNVLVAEDWTCLIADFGTATLLRRMQQAATSTATAVGGAGGVYGGGEQHIPHSNNNSNSNSSSWGGVTMANEEKQRSSSVVSTEFAALQTTGTGTLQWSAPELLLGQPYTSAVDVYSFGILGSEVVTLRLPFVHLRHSWDIRKAVLSGQRPDLGDSGSDGGDGGDGGGSVSGGAGRDGSACPGALAQLLRECWSEDPKARPSFTAIIDRLKAAQARLR